MTYAIGKNLVTCASPGSKYTETITGLEIVIPGCCQPGTIPFVFGDTVLEFCDKCAVDRWKNGEE